MQLALAGTSRRALHARAHYARKAERDRDADGRAASHYQRRGAVRRRALRLTEEPAAAVGGRGNG